ncbi:MAG: hypothetical protein JWL77_1704 [Chthonomonadaceae bacterium]|nr:hypothetical protein [Chthonomonadaceae bacterium]
MAHVTVQVQYDPDGPSIHVNRVGHGFFAPSSLEAATATVYLDWQQGAESGVQHALRVAGREQSHVRILRIMGTDTDTNPTIVGAAAMRAVWNALGYVPTPAEAGRIDQIGLASCQQPYDFVPDFAIR